MLREINEIVWISNEYYINYIITVNYFTNKIQNTFLNVKLFKRAKKKVQKIYNFVFFSFI